MGIHQIDSIILWQSHMHLLNIDGEKTSLYHEDSWSIDLNVVWMQSVTPNAVGDWSIYAACSTIPTCFWLFQL